MSKLNSSWEGLRVSPFPLLDSEKGSMIRAVISCLPSELSQIILSRVSSSGKMSPVYCQRTEDGILLLSLTCCQSLGIFVILIYLMRNILAYHREEGEFLYAVNTEIIY